MPRKTTRPRARNAELHLAALWPFCMQVFPDERRPFGSDWMVGVYFLIKAGEVVYIGQSSDVQKRVDQHASALRSYRTSEVPQGAKDFDQAIWMLLPANELNNFEGALIRGLHPRYNSHGHAPRSALGDYSCDAAILRAFGLEAA